MFLYNRYVPARITSTHARLPDDSVHHDTCSFHMDNIVLLLFCLRIGRQCPSLRRTYSAENTINLPAKRPPALRSFDTTPRIVTTIGFRETATTLAIGNQTGLQQLSAKKYLLQDWSRKYTTLISKFKLYCSSITAEAHRQPKH